MGCRPSKQATSKIRAVEDAEGPRCLCSPRKARKNHKCDQISGNLSKRASGSSRSGSKKHNHSGGSRPRSAKSADLDFPAFSTTTAVYRKSASKTSKITLRLSCDGSTLEIEQCDYDLEKVRGEVDSKPRPWSSAPNLTRLRDNKARLFRDAYLPMKHSASAWSPSVTSTASGSRGGQIRVPVQVNTPEDRLTSPGHLSGQNSSNGSYVGSNSSRDRGGSSRAGESSRTKNCTPSQRCTKVRASSGFIVADERKPLLKGSDDGSQKQGCGESNTNNACDVSSLTTASQTRIPSSNTLESMITDLEYSLGLTHYLTYTSESISQRPPALAGDDRYLNSNVSRAKRSPEVTDKSNSDCSPDFETIPVNVISYLPATHRTQTSNFESATNHSLQVKRSDNFRFSNKPHVTHSIGNVHNYDPMSVLFHGNDRTFQQLTKHPTDLKFDRSGNPPEKKTPHVNTFHYPFPELSPQSDRIMISELNNLSDRNSSQLNHLSPCFLSPVDSESVLKFVTLGCPVSSEMPGFMYAAEDESPLKIFSPQHHIIYPQDDNCTGYFEDYYSREVAGNQRQWDNDIARDERNLSMEYDTAFYNSQESPLENRTHFIMGSYGSHDVSRTTVPSTAKTYTRHPPPCDLAPNVLHNRRKNIPTISPPNLGEECLWGEAGLRSSQDASLTGVMSGTVPKSYAFSQDSERQGNERRYSVGSTSSRGVASTLLHPVPHTSSSLQERIPDDTRPPEYHHKFVQEEAKCFAFTKRRGRDENESQECPMYSKSVANEHEMANRKDGHACCSSRPLYGNMSHRQCFLQGWSNEPRFSVLIDGAKRNTECDWVIANDNARLTTSDTIAVDVSRSSMEEEEMLQADIYKEDADSDSKNADYLMELLCPELQKKTTVAPEKKTHFSYDFAYGCDEYEATSNSDASDNEISPLCYMPIGQLMKADDQSDPISQMSTEYKYRNPLFTSMQSVRKNILNNNILTLQQHLHEFNQIFTLAGGERNKNVSPISDVGQTLYKSEANTVYCIAGPTIHFPGSLDGNEVNSVKTLAHVGHGNAQQEPGPFITDGPQTSDRKISNDGIKKEREKKRAAMMLRVDILARNITTLAVKLNMDPLAVLWPQRETCVGKMSTTTYDNCAQRPETVLTGPQSYLRREEDADSTRVDAIYKNSPEGSVLRQPQAYIGLKKEERNQTEVIIAQNRLDSAFTRTIEDERAFSNDHSFFTNSSDDERSSPLPSSDTTRMQRIPVLFEGARASIDELTSFLWHPDENSKGHQSERPIDSPHQAHLNVNGNPVSSCQSKGSSDVPLVPLSKRISDGSSNCTQGLDGFLVKQLHTKAPYHTSSSTHLSTLSTDCLESKANSEGTDSLQDTHFSSHDSFQQTEEMKSPWTSDEASSSLVTFTSLMHSGALSDIALNKETNNPSRSLIQFSNEPSKCSHSGHERWANKSKKHSGFSHNISRSEDDVTVSAVSCQANLSDSMPSTQEVADNQKSALNFVKQCKQCIGIQYNISESEEDYLHLSLSSVGCLCASVPNRQEYAVDHGKVLRNNLIFNEPGLITSENQCDSKDITSRQNMRKSSTENPCNDLAGTQNGNEVISSDCIVFSSACNQYQRQEDFDLQSTTTTANVSNINVNSDSHHLHHHHHYHHHQHQHSLLHEQTIDQLSTALSHTPGTAGLCTSQNSTSTQFPELSTVQNSRSTRGQGLSTTQNKTVFPHDTGCCTSQQCADSLNLNSNLFVLDSANYVGMVNNSSPDEEDETMETSRTMPRKNVLSLVRYFEKVPYTRNEPKQ